MDDVQKAFLDILSQVRTHLELQRAFGITGLAVFSEENTVRQPVMKTGACPAEEKEIQRSFVGKSSSSSEPVTLETVRAELGECTGCKLNASRKTIVFGEGNPEAQVVFIGDAPGQEEDEQGRPFQDAAGRLLTDIIEKGMKVKRDDVYICTIVKCRPQDDCKPGAEEFASCEPVLIRQLQAIRPKIIVALGATAVNVLLKTNEKIAVLRGTWKTYEGVPVMPTFHPAYLLKNPSAKKEVWVDIKKVISALERT